MSWSVFHVGGVEHLSDATRDPQRRISGPFRVYEHAVQAFNRRVEIDVPGWQFAILPDLSGEKCVEDQADEALAVLRGHFAQMAAQHILSPAALAVEKIERFAKFGVLPRAWEKRGKA